MRLLILGGTRFVGRHLTDAALARGHTVTHLHRGTSAGVWPEVTDLLGDRDGGLHALDGFGPWDAVVDTCGYVPRVVASSAAHLRDRTGRYLFVSTISVYADPSRPCDETAAVGALVDPATEVVDGETYGPLKAACEAVVRSEYGPRATIVRPGLIVGPHDPTDRFTWWPARAARGGSFVAPDRPDLPIQVIDARDLASFLLDLLDGDVGGTFNATSPSGMYTLGDLISAACTAAAPVAPTPPRPVWIPRTELELAGVRPWLDLPVWLPDDGSQAALLRTPVVTALAAGLRCRPLAETMADTLAWHLTRPPAPLRAGLSAEREQEILGEGVRSP